MKGEELMEGMNGARRSDLSTICPSGSPAGEEILDFACVGFGPAGISLAVAVEDWREANGYPHWPRTHFFERNSGPGWQPGLLLRATDINHNFLRDFATPRDPRSRFTFVNYLKESGRLYQFGHLGGRVARTDWDAYVRWTASQLDGYVSYGARVDAVEPYPSAGDPRLISIETAAGSHLARALVVSTGPTPNIPPVFAPHVGPRLFHSAQYLRHVAEFGRDDSLTFAVLGSGQSAGEVLLHLYDRFPNAQLWSVQRGLAFPLVDVGHFSNEVYFPDEVAYFHGLAPEARQRAVRDFHKTNYSAVDSDVSQALYWRAYEDKVLGTTRFRILSRKQPVAVAAQGQGFSITLKDVYNEAVETLAADVVVLCTGYAEAAFPPQLEALRTYIVTDDSGGPEVSFDYRVTTRPDFSPLIYINGNSERTHGASDSQSLSMLALKADRIWQSLLAHLPDVAAVDVSFADKSEAAAAIHSAAE